ncbi:MAG: arsenate reductase/protein-tyrosine-phosphatase family protein [Alkalilacustris sp.]
MEKLIPERLTTLGHPQRLAVFRLLMRRHPDRVPAGELAEALALKPSTLSAYLAALMQAGLVTQARAGTSLRYGVALEAVRETFDHLLLDCCRGRPELCAAPVPERGEGPWRVLFLCTGNSARSILAEAILRREAGARVEAHSAGTRPHAAPNPEALALLQAAGHDTAPLRSKPVEALRGAGAPVFDVVLTVCDRAANEDCPAWPGRPLSAHWGIPPVGDRPGALRAAHDALQTRIRAFLALPLGRMDRRELQDALDHIGQGRTPT